MSEHPINFSIPERAGGISVSCLWHDETVSPEIENSSGKEVRIGDLVIFEVPLTHLPESTRFYGESVSMLSQFRGTFQRRECLGRVNDLQFYRLPEKVGSFNCRNLLFLDPGEGREKYLFGFASCRKFSGLFRFNRKCLEIAVYGENIPLHPGEKMALEEIFFAAGNSRNELFERFGRAVAENHPRRIFPEKVLGWCSWHAYGPEITRDAIMQNLAAIKEKLPELKFIQIDDGYQYRMGDWLVPDEKRFPGGAENLCREIINAGFEPAIWVAPFIASPDSRLLAEHPEYFIRDEVTGEPLDSGKVSFGGWRQGTWRMLDPTHPGAREYLKKVFRTMRREWGCRYFKLDANMWGALPFGRRYMDGVTSVEAYRMGMEAIIEGAGDDAFILGCNAPWWPSLGLCHAMRSSWDIARRWSFFKQLRSETLSRLWMGKDLFLIDPDGVVLRNLDSESIAGDGSKVRSEETLGENEFYFHAAAIAASGGILLSGDVFSEMTEKELNIWRKLLSIYGHGAEFDDDWNLLSAECRLPDRTLKYFFNPDDESSVEYYPGGGREKRSYVDFFTGEKICPADGVIRLGARSARVLEYRN